MIRSKWFHENSSPCSIFTLRIPFSVYLPVLRIVSRQDNGRAFQPMRCFVLVVFAQSSSLSPVFFVEVGA